MKELTFDSVLLYTYTSLIGLTAQVASTWNSDCTPAPIIAIDDASLFARYLEDTPPAHPVLRAVK